MSRRLRAVIFDIDGTLIDSNDAHARAWVDALAEHRIDVPFERVRPLIGMGGDKLLPALAGVAHDSEDGKRLSERRAEIFRQQYFPQLRAFPKTRALLVRLRERGLRIAAASSAKKEELEPFLQLASVPDLLEASTSSGDARHSKPDPDIIQAALERLQVHADQALMIGDTSYDIEAAKRAGLGTIALRCGGSSDAALQGALAIYDDPEHLLAGLETSPLFVQS